MAQTIYGTVNADGTTRDGTGFTSSKDGEGYYSIEFDNHFETIPVVVASAVDDGPSWNANPSAAGRGNVKIGTGGGKMRSLAFSFIAMG
ncbi:hypothetical protein [Embleya sp. MST-111070]|uniref:hypothetical protein n=1 Tax=Embleya sp. MST-111070 TaxID=3398231 RepID=UPI003F73AA2D